MKNGLRLFLVIFPLVLLLLIQAPVWAEEQESDALDITEFCIFSRNGSEINASYSHDGKCVTCNTYKPKDVLSVRSRGDNQMGTLFFRLSTDDARFVLEQYDKEGAQILSSEMQAEALCFAVPLENGCHSIEISAVETPFDIHELTVLGPGRLPDQFPVLMPSIEKTDFLIITTHPDDEWIFLGGIYPIYGMEQGYTGTFAYVVTPNAGRVHEAINSVWSAGMRTMPYFLGFQDIPGTEQGRMKSQFKQEDVALALVRLYRKIKPLVIVTQDPANGEYGHLQHIITARAALDAVTLAQDPTYDPESVEEYGIWSVKKVYQHLAEDGRIMLNMDEPLIAYDGLTAFEVAERAFAEHQSQVQYSYRPKNTTEGYYDMRRFGLTYSAVGPDTGSDMFEHIEHDELTEVLLNTVPSPSPTPDPSSGLTSTAAPTTADG